MSRCDYRLGLAHFGLYCNFVQFRAAFDVYIIRDSDWLIKGEVSLLNTEKELFSFLLIFHYECLVGCNSLLFHYECLVGCNSLLFYYECLVGCNHGNSLLCIMQVLICLTFLPCRYMIDKMDFDPEKAIAAYNAARGYDIERENYLADLKKGKR